MLDTAVTVLIELLFAVVFFAVLIEYIRRRDPLSRDLVLVFGSLASLFVVQPWMRAATHSSQSHTPPRPWLRSSRSSHARGAIARRRKARGPGADRHSAWDEYGVAYVRRVMCRRLLPRRLRS